MKKEFDEKDFLKMALIMAGIVMIFSSVNSIILSYSQPYVPQRNWEQKDQLFIDTENFNADNNEPVSAAESALLENQNRQMLPNMQPIYEENSDVVGWLKIEGTCVDYPVMYTPGDGEFYLYKDFHKNPDKSGSIFIDEHCNLSPRDTNLIFHGHNMNNGSMFGALRKYKSPQFYSEHKKIQFDTLYETQMYEVIAVFISKVYNVTDNVFKYYRFYRAKTAQEFDYFIDNIKQLALYDTGVSAQYGDSLITLSTCENSVKNGRLVLVAKRV